ncbi:hypothetical protein K8T06_10170 [bacterium]|nr:hypothetical protein [bacterium]
MNAFQKTVILTGFALVFLMIIPVSAQIDLWDFDCADCPKMIRSCSDALVINSDGNYIMASVGDQVYLSRYDGVDWSHDVLDTEPGSIELTLRLDSNDYFHLVYLNFFEKEIRYVYEDAGGVHHENIAMGPYLELNGFILDSTGNPHIVYSHFIDNNLFYKYKNSSGWHVETWTYPENTQTLIFHELGQDGSLHLTATGCDTTGFLSYISRDDEGWQSQIVASDGQFESTDLILLSDGSPAVKYEVMIFDPENDNSIWYAVTDGLTWTTTKLQNSEQLNSSSLFTNNLETVQFGFYTTETETLQIATRTESGWDFEDTGFSVSEIQLEQFTINSSDDIRITNFDNNLGGLAILEQTDLTWNQNIVDTTTALGSGSSLCYDDHNNPHLVYIDWSNMDLKYGTTVNGIWETFVVVNNSDHFDLPPEILIDGDGIIHIFYNEKQDDSDNNLRHAYKNGSAWTIEDIDSSESRLNYLCADLDTTGTIHLVYECDTNLKHAYKTIMGTGWDFQIPDEQIKGIYLSMACDSVGNMHLCFWEKAEADLQYAMINSSGELQKETVSVEDKRGYACSIDIDSLGNPHIAYHIRGEIEGLKYAFKDSGEWQIELVDADEFVGCQAEIALDTLGFPHIAYARNCSNIAVKYAFQDDAGWHFETVATSWDDLSIALDNNGYPGITYKYYGMRYAKRNTLPSPDSQGVRLQIPADYYYLDKPFYLDATLYNHGPALSDIPLFILLQIENNFWYWPSWSQEVDFKMVDLPSGITDMTILQEFNWPDTSLFWVENVSFLAALVNTETNTILGDWEGLDSKSFGFGEKVSCSD